MLFIVRQTFVFLFSCVLLSTGFASDQQMLISDELIDWNSQLDKWQKQLSQDDLKSIDIKELRTSLQTMRAQIEIATEQSEANIDALRDELDLLGPAPADESAQEPSSIAAKRKTLGKQLATFEGLLKEVDLVTSRIDKALYDSSVMRMQQFKQEIFTHTISPLFPDTWRKSIHELTALQFKYSEKLKAWISSTGFSQQLHSAQVNLIVSLGLVSLMIGILWTWLFRKLRRKSEIKKPGFTQSLLAACFEALVRTAIPALLLSTGYLALSSAFVFEAATEANYRVILLILISIFAVIACSRAMIPPKHSQWRLLNLDTADAFYVHSIIICLAWVFGLDLIIEQLFSVIDVSLELTVTYTFINDLIISFCLLALLMRKELWQATTDKQYTLFWQRARVFIAILVLVIPLSAAAGYVALSSLFAKQLVLTAVLLMLVKVLRSISTDFTEELLNSETLVGAKIQDALALTSEGRDILRFWLKLALNILILLAGAITFLILWGAAGDDLTNWINKSFFGFKVGSITISISDIVLAILLFTAILVGTRILQRVLEQQILPRTLLNAGIQNSIRAMLGYIGFILAMLIAISTLGVDLSKLAILAGALSVGIGFGLQNVVNNFVSGLILLAERPIKVGDWVVVGDRQGYVKKINVRATEIMTFDRASVFIPNSNLIANPVLNWTHADKTGRVIIPVGVAYGSDTNKVRDILFAIAKDHPKVMVNPAPSVIFKGFGNSALDFELRAFLKEVDQIMSVTSDLCFAINDTFRLQNIDIPFPQQDVHWKDMDRLEKLMESLAHKAKK